MVAMVADNRITKETKQEDTRGTTDRGVASRGIVVPAFSLIELRPAERRFVFTLVSGMKQVVAWGEPFKQPIPTKSQLPAGDYHCLVRPGGSLELEDQGFRFRFGFLEFESLPDEVRKAFDEPKREIPCKVVWGTATDATPDEAQEKRQGAPRQAMGHRFPVKADPEALRTNARLRTFVWELLNHFTNALDKPGAQVSYEDIQALVAKDPNAREIVARTTQAWEEFRSARSQDYGVFERLTETLVEQWTFGNATVRDNLLALRDEPEGWGLYHRGSGIKYYNEFGVPVESFMGTMWEKHYKWGDRSKSTSSLQIEVSPDDAIFALIEAYRAGGVPNLEMIETAAKGYFENLEKDKLLYKEVLRNPGNFDNIVKIYQGQLLFLLGFLTIEGFAVFLETLPSPWKQVGALLRIMLKGSEYFFNIRFMGDAAKVLLEIGAALYRVKQSKDGKLDRLSQRHLAEAADRARGLLEELAALLLTEGTVRTLKETAKILPPQGPLGPTLQLATATTGTSGPRMLAAPASTAVGVRGGPSIPPGIVLMTAGATHGTEAEERKRKEKAEREKTDGQTRAEAERAGREGEKEWQQLEKEVRDYLDNEDKAHDEVRYAGRQANTLFPDLLSKLELRAKGAKSEGALALVRAARERLNRLFNETQTIDNLLDKVGLKLAYEKYQTYVERQLARAVDRLHLAKMNKEQNPAEYRIAYDDVKYLKGLSSQLRRFREGLISRRTFDAVQVFVEHRRVVVTDATMRVKEIFHQMKSIVYREIWQQVFVDFEVSVWEYRSSTAVYEIKPTPDFASELERAIDLQLAQEGTK